ncbi:MAG: hypothetical protein NXI02_32895 [Rhodobacteraceae bacterium]|nr:hypothetical protein [Paracoccaceae bacterium]
MTYSSHAHLSFEIARSQLANRKEDLRGIRNQASFAAALSGLIASVFSSLVPDGQFRSDVLALGWLGVSVEIWFVIISFSGSIAFAIRVGSGWKSCTFELNPRFVINTSNISRDLDEVYRILAIDADEFFDKNEKVISDARTNLWFAIVLGWAQIPAWLLVIF